MKLAQLTQSLSTRKRPVLFALFGIPVVSILFGILVAVYGLNFGRIALASFGVWGDTSLIHACENSRGGIALVAAGASCNSNETQVTWLKDVDAGTGLSISRSSSGATISLANTNTDGWNAAGETWTYASSDAPSFTFTISGDKTGKYSPGMRVKLTQTTDKYFLITAVSYSSPNTTVTVYGGTDYTLANATITNPEYSSEKAPIGFPLDPAKWTEETVYSTNGNQGSPTANTWYNIGSVSLSVPIGAWRLYYSADYGFDYSPASICNAYITLSTSNNSESDVNMTTGQSASGDVIMDSHGYKEKYVNLSSKTTYYLDERTTVSGLNFLYQGDSQAPTIVRATSSYL